MSYIRLYILSLLTSLSVMASAQVKNSIRVNPEDRIVDMDNPTFVPMVRMGKAFVDNDSIQYVELNNVYIYPTPTFQNAKQRAAYNRLVYNVKVLNVDTAKRRIALTMKGVSQQN